MSANRTFDEAANENTDVQEITKELHERASRISNDSEEAVDLLNEIGCAESESLELDQNVVVFGEVLYEARVKSENGRKSGAQFIEKMKDALTGLIEKNKLTLLGSLSLSNSWCSSGLEPPESLASTSPELIDLMESDSPEKQKFLQELMHYQMYRLPPESSDSPWLAYDAITSALPALPDVAKYEFVRMVVGMPKDPFSSLGCSLLFVKNETIRNAAIDGLNDNLKSGTLTSGTLAKLTMVRNWLHDSGTISRLDQLVRDSIKKGFKVTDSKITSKNIKAYASAVDGSGSQSIIVSLKTWRSRNVVMLLLKQGFGVKDAYLIPCQNKREQVETIEYYKTNLATVGLYEVTMEYVKHAVASALHQGAQKKMTPMPRFIDCAEVLGLRDMPVEGGTVSHILAKIDPERKIISLDNDKLGELVDKSRFWPGKFLFLNQWFEKNDTSDEILMSNDSDEVKRKRLYKFLNSRREFWSSCIVRSAMLMSSLKNKRADEFVAVAVALEKSWNLESIPVFEHIVAQTIKGWQYETGMNAGTGKMSSPSADVKHFSLVEDSNVTEIEILENARSEMKKCLAAVNYKLEWMDGYFAGICTAPVQVGFKEFIPDLMELLQINSLSLDEANRTLNLMLLNYNSINIMMIKGRAKEALPSRDSELSMWATGYLSVWDDYPDSWPPKLLGQAGREMKLLMESAIKEEADPADFRKKVAEWMEIRSSEIWS